jgi:hypothetical protein
MSSLKQIEANRLNALKSTGPRTEERKRRSRCNAIRHGLTAETVIVGAKDPEDYESFEATIIADYDPTTAVERELVLRLASILWRLRRATGIETALFQSALKQSAQVQSKMIGRATTVELQSQVLPYNKSGPNPNNLDSAQKKQIAESFLRLSETPSTPIARLSRYEHVLWRQARQILVTLKSLRSRSKTERRGGRQLIFDRRHPHLLD